MDGAASVSIPDVAFPAGVPVSQLAIDTIRTLSIAAVQQANSGHPGTAMALAPVMYTLWQDYLNYDPEDPNWPNRDRFVLSCGHASMLLYSMLHLVGVKSPHPDKPQSVTLDDIKSFRQLGSPCTGHPEHGLTPGVETTTGPLGQGCATSVGMAMAGKWLAQHFNRPDFKMFDNKVYALCSDGDMMEGISSEAASLAGHLMLGNLCWIYDDNRITIDGHTDVAFSDDVAARFKAYGWNVQRVSDANDTDSVARAIENFRSTTHVPTLIIVASHIGWGSPNKHDTSAAHGEPLGEDEVKLTKRRYGWPEDEHFLVPDGVIQHFKDGIGARGRELRASWFSLFNAYRTAHPDLATELTQIVEHKLPDNWDADMPTFDADPKGIATRTASGKVVNAIAPRFPWLLGGAADLASSTAVKLTFDQAGDFEPNSFGGRNLHFGIREHAMAAALNGLALTGLRPFGSTYMIFSDYLKPALRLSALMEMPVIYVFTHDSIGVGEDGPTHQPIEQLLALRSVPNLITFRPADANEVVEAWRMTLALKTEPVALILSRQPVPTIDRTVYAPAKGARRGGYVLADAAQGRPDVILVGTGSEVALCVAAHEALAKEGIGSRVVSLPSWELFELQDQAYRDSVLPPDIEARVSVEAQSVIGWDRYVGAYGAKIGMRTFGSSAPSSVLMKHFGFTSEAVVEAAKAQIARVGKK
jgi:transketolase